MDRGEERKKKKFKSYKRGGPYRANKENKNGKKKTVSTKEA